MTTAFQDKTKYWYKMTEVRVNIQTSILQNIKKHFFKLCLTMSAELMKSIFSVVRPYRNYIRT